MTGKKKLDETASAGATSAGGIASTAGGLHFPLLKRLPPINVFPAKDKKKKKKDE